ncbi:alpha-D-ribose 1-methylphosphonate 5-triphosphate synthase subunit PhnH [Amphritea atlantica]|uniref:Alpha-D-ribose 1-methylphosphonate 5-triphosphate synthase subunit PhnH n=1 Tax=Amphritea atlantica TaxID=355243 RepID=A0A1H9DC37_9GAMM|nr:phosphonate C-P lyase system protein PhnH [Amphritea atlantica]SEQ11020.1 alpha-D-ribose 1-methylphosphonate 5-triphosphate synthase subunit PhnH [Amphritea atlantica]
MNSIALQIGFQEPVTDAQQVFRSLLKVMSEPGVIESLDQATTLETLCPAAFSTCLALLDSTTRIWLAEPFNSDAVAKNLSFHTGCRLTQTVGEADFVLCRADQLPQLDQLKRGSAEYPDRGCTLLVQVDQISDTALPESTVLRLQGPGIPGQRTLAISSLPRELIHYLTGRPDPFPLGLDIVLLADNVVTAIPRTTRVEVN